jgi:hypothetical protein
MGHPGTVTSRLAGRRSTTFRHVPESPPPIAVWRGLPSGEVFADLLRQRADRLGIAALVDVTAWEFDGAYGVTVDWPSGDAMYEVADWVDGARVLDTGDDVTIDQALDYLSARVAGRRPGEAIKGIAPSRPSFWVRLRRWGR